MKNITAGANPLQMKRGIDKAVAAVIVELGKLKKDLSEDDWQSVATISAQNPEIGAKIAEALKLVGRDGVVTVEESKGMEFEIEHKGDCSLIRVMPQHTSQQTLQIWKRLLSLLIS